MRGRERLLTEVIVSGLALHYQYAGGLLIDHRGRSRQLIMVQCKIKVILPLLALLGSVTSQCTTGSLRLHPADGSTTNGTLHVGLLMVCRDGVWGTIQVDSVSPFWSVKNSLVACRHLGFKAALNTIPAIQVHPNLRPGSDVPVLYRSAACTGVEDLITDCPGITVVNNIFTHFADVYVVCLPESQQYNDLHTVRSTTPQFGEVRLVGDTVDGSGAVEIFTNVGWSTICPDSSWSDSDAAIICENLGYDTGISRTYTISSSTTVSPVMVKDSQCVDRRVPSLFRIDGGHCSFALADVSNPCTVRGFAGVVCRSTSEDESIQLFGYEAISSSNFVGVVEYHLGGRWGVLCAPTVQNSFTASLLCRELGIRRDESSFYGSLSTVQLQNIESRQKPAWLLDFSCDTSDKRLRDCNIVTPVGYGKCARSGDILVLDCGPRRQPLHGGIIAAIVVPIAITLVILLVLLIHKDKWKPKLKNSKCWKFTCGCLRCQCLKHCKASVSQRLAKWRNDRQRQQASRQQRQAERQQRRDEERAAREAAREAAQEMARETAREAAREAVREAARETAREIARDAVIDEAANIPTMTADAAHEDSELSKTAPPPYPAAFEYPGNSADLPPPYFQQQ